MYLLFYKHALISDRETRFIGIPLKYRLLKNFILFVRKFGNGIHRSFIKVCVWTLVFFLAYSMLRFTFLAATVFFSTQSNSCQFNKLMQWQIFCFHNVHAMHFFFSDMALQMASESVYSYVSYDGDITTGGNQEECSWYRRIIAAQSSKTSWGRSYVEWESERRIPTQEFRQRHYVMAKWPPSALGLLSGFGLPHT